MNKTLPAFLASVACGCLLAGPGCGGSTSESPPVAAGGAAGDAGDSPEGAAPDAKPESSPEGGSLHGFVGKLEFLGPWGGQVSRIVASASDPSTLFAVVSGKLFRTNDEGGSWEEVKVTDWSVHAVLPLADGRIFAGTDLDVMLSSDAGATWKSISTGSIEPGYQFGVQVKALAWQPGTPGRLWAGLASFDSAAIWYLEDGANAWKPWTAPPGWVPKPDKGNPAQISDIEIVRDPATEKDIIVASYDKAFSSGGGVYCSRDSGATFLDCGAGLPSAPFHRVSLYEGIVLIAGGHPFGNAYAGVYYSTDQAETWQEFNGGHPNAIANDVMRKQDGTFAVGSYAHGWMTASTAGGDWTAEPELDGQEVSTVFERPNKDLLAGLSTLGAKRKTTGGGWQNASNGLALVPSVDATVDPEDSKRMLVSVNAENSGMVAQTANGIDGWAPIAALPHPRFKHVSISPGGKWYVVSDGPTTQANDGIYVSSDQGATWDFLGPLTGSLMDQEITGIAETGGSGLIAAGATWPKSAAFLMVSSDSGNSWTEAWKGVEGPRAGRLIMTEAGDAFMPVADAGGGLVRMLKGAAAEYLTIGEISGGVTDADVCPGDADKMIVAGPVDKDGTAHKLLQSSDRGATWKELEATAKTDEFVFKVAYHPKDCNVIIVATTSGAVRTSITGGVQWHDLDLPATKLKTYQNMRAVGSMLLIIGDGGIWGAPLMLGGA